MPERFTSLQEAVGLIPDGAHVAFGGFTVQRHPMAFIYEMIRQKKRNLHVYGHSPGGDLDILIGAGCVKRIEIAYEADEAFGTIGPCMRRAIQSGAIEWEDYSNFGMVLRFSAGALGLPYMPTKTMFGSDLLKREGFPQSSRTADRKIASAKYHIQECPFTHENLVLVPAINADFCVLHVQQVGTDGTVRIYGQSFGDVQEALGARTLIVTCEEIVDANQLRAEPERNQIPFFRVHHIVHVPYGAHPSACFGSYDYDPEQLAIYHERAKDAKAFKTYLDEFVYGVKDHKAYLDKIGGVARLGKLTADPTLGYNPTLKRRL